MDYSKYKMSKRELLFHGMIAAGLLALVAKLFYGQISVAIALSPFITVFIKLKKIEKNKKRKKELKNQFKDAILSIADLIQVGYSVENAVTECYREMAQIHGESSYICKELRDMIQKMNMNATLEALFADLTDRTGIHDIVLFSQVFSVAKRMGGNMEAVIHMVAENISQSMQVEEEISVAMSEKKLEQRIMSLVPMVMIVYVTASSPGFLDIMYETVVGKVVMTICLVAYGTAVCMAEKIMHIEM